MEILCEVVTALESIQLTAEDLHVRCIRYCVSLKGSIGHATFSGRVSSTIGNPVGKVRESCAQKGHRQGLGEATQEPCKTLAETSAKLHIQWAASWHFEY